MSRRMAGTMNHFETQLADFVNLSVAPVLIGLWRLLVIKPILGPLRTGNSQPTRLVRQFQIHGLISRMNGYLRFGLELLQRCNSADVIKVSMRAGDGLQLKTMLVDGANDVFRRFA